MKGQCLCKSVTIEAPDVGEVGLCHCSMCRRWGGGPMFAVHVADGITVDGADNVTHYQSSDWAQRAFCKTCGSHLYYKLLPSNEYILSAGLFQDRDFAMNGQIFIDEKPGWYALANETPTMTGAEVFAKFAPPE